MNYSSLKLYIPYNNIRFSKSAINEKYLSFLVMSENDDALTSINNISFDGNPIRNYIVPTSPAPFRTYMNADYKTNIKNSGYIPIKSNINEINKFNNKHMYIDVNRYFDAVVDRLNTQMFNNQKYTTLFFNYLNSVVKFVPTNFVKNLIYTVNIDKEFSNKLLNKKILPLYLALLNGEKIEFDKIFIVYYSPKQNTKEFILIYDSSKKENIAKIRSILLKYKSDFRKESEEISSDMFDFDEDEIKTANNFNERYSHWNVAAYYHMMNENAKLKLIKHGYEFGKKLIPKAPRLFRRAKPLANAATDAASGAMNASGAVRNVVGQAADVATNTATPGRLRRAGSYVKNAGTKFINKQKEDWSSGTWGKAKVLGRPAGLYFGTVGDIPSAITAAGTALSNTAASLTGNLTPDQRRQEQLRSMGKAAVIGAGALGAAGMAYAAWQRAKQRKEENYYANGCANLQGGQLSQCIQSVNNLKMKNLQSILQACGEDQECVEKTNAEINDVQQAMSENRIAG